MAGRRFARWALRCGALAATASCGTAVVAAQETERIVHVVAPNGDDAGPGTAAQPWRTISKAASSAEPGAVVDIRAGTYSELVTVRVSGMPGQPTTFRAHPGERVTISGRGIGNVRDAAGLVKIEDESHIEIVGLELRDLVDRRNRATPAGVWVTGESSGIALRNLDIHGIQARHRRGNAHGIAVYGTSGDRPISNIAIEGNTVHDLRLGASEAIVVNGNVEHWRVVGNTIDDVDNIGIDAIGYEETAPRNDRARNGLIAQNTISDVDTLGNPAYLEDGENCRCAGGIYVDGGKDIVIEQNRVTRSNLGIELASEHRHGATSDILVRNNLVTRSDRAGLTMGGYDTRRGRTERAHVVNNTFLDNDRLRDGVGEVELNHRISASAVLNNVFRAGRAGIMVTNQFRRNSGNRFDGNVWFAVGKSATTARWQWRTKALRGFDAWRRTVAGDLNGRYADPLVGLDGVPARGSPVVDAGVASPLAGETDLAGRPRVQGAGVDAGALESSP